MSTRIYFFSHKVFYLFQKQVLVSEHFIVLTVNAFNLDKSNSLWLGKELTLELLSATHLPFTDNLGQDRAAQRYYFPQKSLKFTISLKVSFNPLP